MTNDAVAEGGERGKAPGSGALSWSVHPFLLDARRSLLLLAAFLLIWLAGGVLLGPDGLIIAILASVVPMAHYLLPNHYTLSEEGVQLRVVLGSGVKEWDRFIGYTVYPDGALVAYDPAILRNRIVKGIFLRFDGNRDDVIRFLEAHLPGEGYYAPGAGGPPDGIPSRNPPASHEPPGTTGDVSR